MITPAPFPEWKTIFRSFFNIPQAPANLIRHWQREGDTAGWLSRSAWSFALIANWRRKMQGNNKVIVWLPDFFCNASLTPLRCTDAQLCFYPLTKQMLPDIAACKEMAGSQKPDIFVIVHYFGKPSVIKEVNDFCSQQGAWLVEDAAHALKPVKGIGVSGDFVLYSPHKHLPVPDGAVLVVRSAGPAKFAENAAQFYGQPETWPSQLQELQKQMGTLVKNSRTHSLLWLVKRVIQKLNVKFWNTQQLPFTESADSGITTPLIDPIQSSISRKFMSDLTVAKLNLVARKRQRNQLVLDELLKKCGMLSPSDRPVGREWTPYMAGYIAKAGEGREAYEILHNKGLAVATWPDLPPEVIKGKIAHAYAWSLRHERIYVAVHQSIRYRQLIKKVASGDKGNETATPLRLEWGVTDKKNWQQWINASGKSNLLQSWEYGNSKSQEGWNPKRGVFFLGNEPAAIVQVLEKKFFNIITINRINRGPLILKRLSPVECASLYTQIGALGNFLKLRVLFAAPEMPLSGNNLVLLEKTGFKQFSLHPWESIWLDLTQEETVLRKKLDGKWRNMLKFSEKSDLQLETGETDELFNWLMIHYEGLMKEKNFGGMSPGFLSNLRNDLSGNSRLLVLRATHNTEYVAGICVVCHGNAATYLIGWNGNNGRTVKANQFLLWNAITHLKQLGIEHFDLGGINEEDVPGITAFKAGLNGEFYELAGEYVKW